MRVLYLVTRADLGGAQVHILDLIQGLRSEVDAAVGVGETGYFTERLARLGVPYYVLPNLVHPIAPIRDSRALGETVRLIRNLKPDVVHAHTSKAGVIGRLAARMAGVASVFTAHTWCFAEGTSWKWRVLGVPAECVAGSLSSAIINVSQANRDLALRYWVADPRKVVTIWNGIPDSAHRARPGDESTTPVIAMVARFVEQKNQGLLLRAIARLQGRARVVFAGDGPLLPAAEREARELGVASQVEFLGRRSDIAEILSRAHVFALPTNWEGFPLSILEAMRAGLPVVASDAGGVAESIVDGVTGYLVPRSDDDLFVDRLSALVADPALRARLGLAGRERYQSTFTLDQMLWKTLAVLRGAQDRHRHSGRRLETLTPQIENKS
jgi:glycosyltransferase involved in cell wall biosynthesis